MNQPLDAETLNQLYRYGIALSGNEAEAEDLLQTAIERVLKQDAQDIQDYIAYTRRTMRNLWFDHLRKHRSQGDTVSFDEDELNDPISLEEPSMENYFIDEIDLSRRWGQLSDEQRELLYFWCVLGMTAQEISDETGVSRGTILSRIHRLTQQLNAKLANSRENTL